MVKIRILKKLFFLLLFQFILILIPSTYKKKIVNLQNCPRTIVNGHIDNNYCVFELDKKTISNIINIRPKLSESFKKKCLKKLPPNYIFLDYSYEIVNSRLYTFHRDLTSSQSYQKLKHPSYTVIVYLYDGEFLNICPDSLKKWTVGKPMTIKGKKGTAILFNADMAHAAAPYYTEQRHCLQYKICHSDDIIRLNHLNKQHIIKKSNKANKIRFSEYYLSRLSHKYLLLNDTRFIGNISERKNNSIISKFFRIIFNLDFYNDT
tara:strand:+ start:512 stop:1300 length:789 start_codon:yes stop_codon:yes gene_type:complete